VRQTYIHSITSSARASSVGGASTPGALAVVRLMTRSNLVGCSTGMSPGLVPRRIRSTMSAARRKQIGEIGSVRHETAGLNIIAGIKDRRQPRAERKSDNARAVGGKEGIAHDVKRVLGLERRKSGRNVLRPADFEWFDFQAERASHGLNLIPLQHGLGKANINHDCQSAHTRDNLTQ
jgi:hypothetical protein